MDRVTNQNIDWTEIVEHTAKEEQEGKKLWEKLQNKEITCSNLSDEQFGNLGEYFMGQMMGNSHAAMNAMMIQTHGEDGEAQIHIAMGKRLSGCETSAPLPSISGGWMPMMNMMWGGWWFPFGWIVMILWVTLLIVATIALVKWLANQFRKESSDKSALDILKERYAKGEIDKKEFEEKKKDLLKLKS